MTEPRTLFVGATGHVGSQIVSAAYISGLPYVRSGLWTGAIASSVVVGWPLL